MHDIYDIIGVGFGPANIALAVAFKESKYKGALLFLEKRKEAVWQPNMMLPGSDIQNHPCRDLVTPRNPQSYYSFINYLHKNNKLYEHLNLGMEFPFRKEFAGYVSWVANFFSNLVKFNANVSEIQICRYNDESLYKVTTRNGVDYYCRSLVVAPGRTPHVPDVFLGKPLDKVFHLNSFLPKIKKLYSLNKLNNVAVIGGSQSAIEIVLYLNQKYPNLKIYNLLRGYGYRLKDTSPFNGKVYFPSFVDEYYNADFEGKDRFNEELHFTNYSSADKDVITNLYSRMYEQNLESNCNINIHTSSTVESCYSENNFVAITVKNNINHDVSEINELDAIILATGFKNLGVKKQQVAYPEILEGIIGKIKMNERNYLHIERDYRLLPLDGIKNLPPIYLNGLCESSHGYGDAGSFSLLALRSQDIVDSLTCALKKDEEISYA